MQAKEFLERADEDCKKQLDRAIALLWFVGREDQTVGLSAKEIASLLQAVGHPQQNVSRLDGALRLDRRTASAKGGSWTLRPAARKVLEGMFQKHVGPRELPASDTIVPMFLLTGTRRYYIECVGSQINRSFDAGLYDCCAVMCRRLLETLIIEIYEHAGRASEIRRDDAFLSLADLIVHLEKDKSIFLSKHGMKALKDFKRLGDLSAHNRRYNAHASDIAPLRDGLRLVTQEMLNMAGLYAPGAISAAA